MTGWEQTTQFKRPHNWKGRETGGLDKKQTRLKPREINLTNDENRDGGSQGDQDTEHFQPVGQGDVCLSAGQNPIANVGQHLSHAQYFPLIEIFVL